MSIHDSIDDDRTPDPDPPDLANASRRPADVWVLRGCSGGQEAWDFSITSECELGPTLPDPTSPSGIFTSVESRKNAFLDTASQCTKAGITFCPLILEAAGGGWSDALRWVVARIASESKRSGPIDDSDASFKIAQRIPCALHRENARAILKRAPEPLGSTVGPSVCRSWPSLSSRNSSSLVVFPVPVSGPAWFLVGVLPFLAQDLRVLCVAYRSDSTKTAISVDISNAFNAVHRSAVLQSVRTHFPSLVPWVDWCYRHDTIFCKIISVLTRYRPIVLELI